MSDMVIRRTLNIADLRIAGYGIPNWSVVVDDKPSVNTTEDIPMVWYGCSGEVVRAAQILLVGRGYNCGSAGTDGDFGPST